MVLVRLLCGQISGPPGSVGGTLTADTILLPYGHIDSQPRKERNGQFAQLCPRALWIAPVAASAMRRELRIQHGAAGVELTTPGVSVLGLSVRIQEVRLED
jgi:hypothetical protein